MGLSLRQRSRAASALIGAAWRAARGDQKGTTRVLSQFLPAPSTRKFARRGTLDLLQAYSEIPALRTCVDLVADAYARVIWEAYKAGSRNQEQRAILRLRAMRNPLERGRLRAAMIEAGDVILDADVIKFLDAGSIDPRNPTEGLDGYQTKQGGMKHRLLAGERFVIMDREGVGKGTRKRGLPASQVLIMPHQVQGIPTQTDRFFIVRTTMGQLLEVPAEDVLWQKEIDPADVYGRGTGAAHALSTEIDADEAMAGHVADVFQRGTRPDLLLVGDFGGDDAESEARRKRGELRWEQGVRRSAPFWMSNVDDEGKPAVTVHDLSKSFVDLDARNLRGFGWEVIRQVLGRIPPELLGVTGNSNRATIDAAWYVLSTGTILPLCEGDRSFYRARLLPEFGPGIDIDFQSPVDEDWDFHLRAMQARPQAFTIDDWRGMAGQQDLDGGKGKVFLWSPGDVPVIDPTEDPFASAPSVPREPTTPGASLEADEDPEAMQESLLDLPLQPRRRYGERDSEASAFPVKHRRYNVENGTTGLQPVGADKTDRVTRAASYVMIDRIAASMEKRLGQLFLQAVERRRADIDEADLVAALISRNYAAALDALPAAAFAADVQRSAALLREVFTAAGAAAANALGKQLGKDVPWDQNGRRAVVWAPGRARELQEWAAASVRDTAQRVIDHGEGLGWTPAVIGGAVLLTYGLASFLKEGKPAGPAFSVLNHRAELEGLGQTAAEAQDAAESYRESLVRHRAQMFGGDQAYSAAQSGQGESWMQAREKGLLSPEARRYWVTRDDARVCPTCSPMHGQKRDLAEAFVSAFDGESYMRPGDPHDGCRCAVLIVNVKGGTN